MVRFLTKAVKEEEGILHRDNSDSTEAKCTLRFKGQRGISLGGGDGG